MSKNDKKVNKNLKQNNKEKVEKRDYKNPVESAWGKIIIWVLIFGMAGLVLIGSIVTIIQAFK